MEAADDQGRARSARADKAAVRQRAKVRDDLRAASEKVGAITERVGRPTKIMDSEGNKRDFGVEATDVKGEPFVEQQMALNHISPQITNITGEAVDKKIIYAAQYGTPVEVKDGWYWSASASTAHPGVYPYTMHITVYDLVDLEDDPTWVPVNLTHEAYLKVTNERVRNGFTSGGVGFIPVCGPAGGA